MPSGEARQQLKTLYKEVEILKKSQRADAVTNTERQQPATQFRRFCAGQPEAHAVVQQAREQQEQPETPVPRCIKKVAGRDQNQILRIFPFNQPVESKGDDEEE